MNANKEKLILSASKLYSVGIEVEAARARLKELVENGLPYSDERVLAALNEFQELKAKWDSLEKQHLELRNNVLREE